MADTITESVLSDPQIHSIGLVAAEWGYAESMLERLIWTLAKINTVRGQSITTHLHAVTREQIAKTLANETLYDLGKLGIRDEIIAAVDQFDGLRTRRNKIIHANWQIPESLTAGKGAADMLFHKPPELGGAVSRTLQAKGKIEVKEQTFDPLEIKKTAEDITALIIRLSRATDLLPAMPASEGIGLAAQSPAPTQNPDPTKK